MARSFVVVLTALALVLSLGAQEAQAQRKKNKKKPPTDLRLFVFGNSLILHTSETEETTMPHWLHALARSSKRKLAVDGQFGFLADHMNFAEGSPRAQWELRVPRVWNGSTPFARTDFNAVMLVPANFIQHRAPDADPPDEPMSTLDRTAIIFDWVNTEKPGLVFYLYEGWPDMGNYCQPSFPPNAARFTAYKEHALGPYHQWWLQYHDGLREARPQLDVRLVPVSSLIAKLLTATPLQQIPAGELYLDDGPHGKPTIYFLAGLINYMAIYQTKAPKNFRVPDSIHPMVRAAYPKLVELVWKELRAFKDARGQSRLGF